MRDSLALVVKEGLENTIQRHYNCAQRLYKGMKRLGLEFYIENEKYRVPAVTTFRIPNDVDWQAIVSYLMDTYGVEIGLGSGITAGKVLRIGLMGHVNAQFEKVDFILKALEEALNYGRELRRKGIAPKMSMAIV